jgi:hypothetical protein
MNKTIVSYTVIFVCILIIANGCMPVFIDGRSFDSKPLANVEIKKSTRADILKCFGKPEQVDEKQINNETYDVVLYMYTKGNMPQPPLIKALAFEFKTDTLTGFSFMSQFPEDKTEIDTMNFFKILPGQFNKASVKTILGQPHGQSVLPTTFSDPINSNPQTSVEVWRYCKFVWDKKNEIYIPRLFCIYFDLNDVVVSTSYD